MIDELLEHEEVTSDLLEAIELDDPFVFLKKWNLSKRKKIELLLGLKEEVNREVIPPLRDLNKLESLDEWFRDNLLHRAGFQYDRKSPYRIRLDWENNPLSEEPEGRLRELLALEIFDFLSTKGFQAVKECPHCKKVFLARGRTDKVCCSGVCRTARHRSSRRRKSKK